jgi:hypothetical protein
MVIFHHSMHGRVSEVWIRNEEFCLNISFCYQKYFPCPFIVYHSSMHISVGPGLMASMCTLFYLERISYLRFEGFTVVTMKNAVFWDVALCRSGVNQCFGGTYRRLQPPAHAGFSHVDFSTLKMKAIHSSKTSVHTRST